jgi:hypothetical protein
MEFDLASEVDVSGDNIFVGNDIVIEELPNGCNIIKRFFDGDFPSNILVASKEDAEMIIKSLQKMIDIQFK